MRTELEGRHLKSLDTETYPIGKGHVAPKMVCITVDSDLGEPEIWTRADHPDIEEKLRTFLTDGKEIIVTANGNYDFMVLISEFPGLITEIFDAYEEGRIICVQTREKLMDLSYSGVFKNKYSLSALEYQYGIDDRAHMKTGDDIWRLRYSELDGIPTAKWPEGPLNYALGDATNTLAVAHAQTREIEYTQPKQDITLGLHSASALALDLTKAHGMWTDQERVNRLSDRLDVLLHPNKMKPLEDAGVLRPAQPPRPYANGCGKMTAGKPESVNKKVLMEFVAKLFQDKGKRAPKTDGGKSGKKQIKTDADVMDQLSGMYPNHDILTCWLDRASVIKLRNTYLPHLREGIVYSSYDYLKKTGRVSSRGDSLFPSTNMQNIPTLSGELSIRECFIPRPGKLFLACDYSSLELCSAAQTCYTLLGESKLREIINDGHDAHAYLGAQICRKWDAEFARICQHTNTVIPFEVYQNFMTLKVDDAKLFKHYRTFAKPTGLGYPGGLGPATFVDFARTTYNVIVTLEEAEDLRDLWHSLLPEFRQYFNWVNQQHDPYNLEKLCYVTPLGMRRAGTTYCQTANGMALQSPAAEGMKAAHWEVTRAMWDISRESILFGCRCVDIIHDEILAEIPDDELASERAKELQRIMENTMAKFLPDVTISTEASLMHRWYKEAEPVFDQNDNLLPWEPTHQN